MKVQKIKLNAFDVTWLVLDNNHLPIKPITEFIRYLNNIDKSPYTVKSYAYCLKLFWEYLTLNQLNWPEINLADLAGFVGWLRQSKTNNQIIDLFEINADRKPASINVILGCLSSFYRFHNQLGNTDVKVTETVNLPNNRYKALLHHVYKNKPSQRRVVSVKQIKQPPKTITEQNFIQIVNACTNYRDHFLVFLLYETGIRIGQALALRHEDIICWNNEIHIKYRSNNLNLVRNKTLNPNTLQVSSELMRL